MPFFEEIGHDNSVECWCDELQIFHNPNARNPLPEGAEASGAIQRRAVILDPTIMGFGITVFAYVRLKAHDEATLEAPERAACDRAEIVDCFSMSGDFDYSFRIVVQSIDDYERFLVPKEGASSSTRHLVGQFTLRPQMHQEDDQIADMSFGILRSDLRPRMTIVGMSALHAFMNRSQKHRWLLAVFRRRTETPA